MIKTARWPRSCNCLNLKRLTECPKCKSGEVGSTPNLTRRVRLSSSFFFSSASLINCEPPRLRSSIVSSGDSILRLFSGRNAGPDLSGAQIDQTGGKRIQRGQRVQRVQRDQRDQRCNANPLNPLNLLNLLNLLNPLN